MESIFASYDFDFFPAMPRLTDRIETSQGNAAAAFVYDWGTSEAGPIAAMQDWIWHQRAGSFRRLGLDLTKEFTIRPDRGSATVDEFLSVVNPDRERRRLAWYPSHTSAFLALQLVNPELVPVAVWHFDAHHDLGYGGAKAIERLRETERCTCEDWLFAALDVGLVSRVNVVYPDWRGMDEWNPHDIDAHGLGEARPWLEGYDVEVHVWSEVKDEVRQRFQEDPPVGQFLARSDSWTPPYLDGEFARLVDGLTGDSGIVHQLPLEPEALPLRREWDPKQVEEMEAWMDEAMQRLGE